MLKWLALILLLFLIYQIRDVFPPFIVGGIIAYLLLPLVKWVNKVTKNGIKPLAAVGVIYILFAASVGFAAWHGFPTLADQAHNLFEQRKEIITNLLDQIVVNTGWQINVEDTTSDLLNSIEQGVGRPEELVHMGGLISKSLLSILICVVSSIYLLLDGQRVGRFFLRFLPEEKRSTVVNLAGQMNVMFSKYVVGQLLLIIIMSTVAFCILSFFKLKYALLIAIVSGCLEIIPVLGPLLAICIATIVGVSQIGMHGLWIPAMYWVARLVEDYVVVPKLIGHAVELHPLAVIFAVMVGETLAGALGMLIAIPVAASVKVVLDFCYPPEHPETHHEKSNPLSWLGWLFKPAKHHPKDPSHWSDTAAQEMVNEQAKENAAMAELMLVKEQAALKAEQAKREKQQQESTDNH
jgi:predicted PurR-regulated permease PerM